MKKLSQQSGQTLIESCVFISLIFIFVISISYSILFTVFKTHVAREGFELLVCKNSITNQTHCIDNFKDKTIFWSRFNFQIKNIKSNKQKVHISGVAPWGVHWSIHDQLKM